MAYPITWQLAHDTPLRRWCEPRLANLDAVQTTWPRSLRMQVPRLRPDPLPPWLIGAAFDWRLRLGLELPPPEIVTTAHAGYDIVVGRRWSRIAMTAEYRGPADDHPVGLLSDARAHGAGADVVGLRDEDMLARTSVLLARYEACYRTGQVRGDDPLLEVGDTIDRDDLLMLCPDDAAVQIGPHGVLANAVAPGFIETRMCSVEHLAGDWYQDVYLRHGKIPVRRHGQAAEVAEAVAWLASDANTYVNGQVVGVDGGLSATF